MCRHNALKGTCSDISPIHWQYGAIARLKKGEKIGELHIFENNIQIDCINVLVNQEVEQKNYFDFIVEILDNWSIA